MRKPILAVLLFASLTACNKKPKLEGKITGYKPGSTTVVLVHAKAIKGARVWCAAGGHACDPFDMPASGEKDIEVDLNKGDLRTPSKVMLTASYRDKNEEQVPLDLVAALPPALEMSTSGYLSCRPRECSGSIDVKTSTVEVFLTSGTAFQVGSTKLTADASGHAKGPVTIAPAPKDTPLTSVCTGSYLGDSAKSRLLVSLPVTVTFPDKVTATSKFDVTTEFLATTFLGSLADVKKGPVPFAWEAGGATKGKPASVYLKESYCYAGGAADATIKDLRVVVLGEDKPRTTTCDYAFSDGSSGTATLTMHDELATAYDRATGKVLGTKLFAAAKQCDREVTTKNRNFKPQSTYADSKAMAAWGATLAR